MSKAGKLFFLFAFLFFVGLLSFRLVYGGWHDALWVPLVLSIVLFLSGLAKDRLAIVEFFTMRTTQHGLNMGALIALSIAGLACVNFLAVRYDKKFDWTSERINSLSDQSIKAAQALKRETEIVLLYTPAPDRGENVQRSVRDLVSMYSNVSDKIKHTAYNALQRPDLSQKYEFTNGAYAVFAIQGETRVRIDQPTEEGVTRALIKLGREKKKVAYFVVGHGEMSPDESGERGLSALKQDLSVTYDVRTLTLYQAENKVPDDADLVAVVGAQMQLLESELQALRDFARRGGSLFIAVDPGLRHNLAQLIKTFGVEFGNDYVLDLRSQIVRAGPATVLGTDFSRNNEITRAFESGQFAIFPLSSNLKKAPDAFVGLEIEPLVMTDPRSMNVPAMVEKVEFRPNGPHTLMMSVRGRDASMAERGDASKEPSKGLSVVIAGDSDFISNNFIHNNLNRDLAMNAFSSLMQDKDLISIRPKAPKGTKLEMTQQSFAIFILAFLLPLPFLLFAAGGFTWWRRRAA